MVDKIKRRVYITIRFLLALCLVIPVILQYLYYWNVSFKINNKTYSASLYGLYLVCYLTIQFVFSIINNNGYNSIINIASTNNNKRRAALFPMTNIIVVGYKEDPVYFDMCLQSIRDTFNNVLNINKVYVIIDGNETDDEYMVDIFKSIFKRCNNIKTDCIKLDKYEISDDELILDYMEIINNNDIICISQKHNGKRDVMNTGFQMTLLESNLYNKNILTVFCTDSDTVISPECINEMFNVFKNESVGAATGNLSIYNRYDSVITFLSSVRYWYAFNVERAYQSFNGCVLCVSGPLGMYRLKSVEKILDEWNKQEFLGKRCTYGDDRHLTNKILGLGEKVVYIANAYAETETPSSIYRFYKQQIRWNKSSFREFFWNIGIIDRHSFFMTVDLVYVLVYPYLVIGYILYILWNGNVFELSFYLSVLFVLGIFKSIHGMIMGKRLEYIFYCVYGLVYISVVFPAKIWGMVTINDNSWGTSTRKLILNNIKFDLCLLVLWNITLITGFSYCIYKSKSNDIYYLIGITSIWCFTFLCMYIYVKTKKHDKNYKFYKNI